MKFFAKFCYIFTQQKMSRKEIIVTLVYFKMRENYKNAKNLIKKFIRKKKQGKVILKI